MFSKLIWTHRNITTLPNYLFYRNTDTPIQEIDLSFNFVTILRSHVLESLSRLKIFNISHNEITVVEKELFSTSPLIQSIDLSYNKIWRLEVNFGVLSNLEMLNLFHNSHYSFNERQFRSFLQKDPQRPLIRMFSANFSCSVSLCWTLNMYLQANIDMHDVHCGPELDMKIDCVLRKCLVNYRKNLALYCNGYVP